MFSHYFAGAISIAVISLSLLTASARAVEAGDARITQALTLLNQQPKTQGNVQESERILSPLAKSNDDMGCRARYLLARIAEIHTDPRDPELAIRRYGELIEANPSHHLAQKAMVKQFVLRLYQGADDPRALLEEAEGWSDRLTDTSALRDYHLVMGRSLLFFGMSKDLARVHFEAAEKIGLSDPVNRANVLITIAELLRSEGRPKLAKPYYERFLADFSRDQRKRIVTERLEEITGQP